MKKERERESERASTVYAANMVYVAYLQVLLLKLLVILLTDLSVLLQLLT